MLDFISKGFNSPKLKSHLKMSAGRLEIDTEKKTALMKQNMREIAELLNESPPKEDKARLRTEAIIRDDNYLVAYDILRLECLLLMERVSIMNHCHECPPDLIAPVSDIVFAAPRLDIPEMAMVRKQFRQKYGRDFKLKAMRNEGGILNEKIVKNLENTPPSKQTVYMYMQKICKQHEVDWAPTVELTEADLVPHIPVTTGVQDSPAGMATPANVKEMERLQGLAVMPPPFAPGHNADDTSVTSKSSSGSSGKGNLPPPPAEAPVMAVAMPCISRQ